MLDTLARVDVKRALPDGRRKLVMTGVELLEKLVPLIPPTNTSQRTLGLNTREGSRVVLRGLPLKRRPVPPVRRLTICQSSAERLIGVRHEGPVSGCHSP
jgi:hypothetical protein